MRQEVAANNSFKEQNQPLPKVPTEAATALIPGTEANEQVVSVDVHNEGASTRM